MALLPFADGGNVVGVDARRALGAAAVSCALVLAGCTSDEPAQPPSPSPTPASQSPTETAQERQERLDYAAAEKSYRTFRAEYNRVLRAGGASEPTKVMKATAGGPYLTELAAVAVAYRGTGAHNEGLERIRYVRPEGYAIRALILKTCEDGRAITTTTSTRKISGEIRMATLEVRKVGTGWKVWSGNGKKVTACS